MYYQINNLAQTRGVEGLSTTSNATAVILVIIVLAIYLVSYLINAVSTSVIFKKARETPAWAAWVPFWGEWKLFKIAGVSPWLSIFYLLSGVFATILRSEEQGPVFFILGIISLVGFVLALTAAIKLSTQLTKSFGLGKVINFLVFFLRPIGLLIIAFGKSQYTGNNLKGVNDANINPPIQTHGPQITQQ